ncbi:MAG: S8 family peptidase [Casimicrobium sp.]
MYPNFSLRALARHVSAPVAATFLFCLPLTSVSAGGVSPEALPDAANFTNRLIVKMAQSSVKGPSLSATDGAQIAVAMSSASGRTLSFSHQTGFGAAILKTTSRMTLPEAASLAAQIAAQPGVEYAEPDSRMFTMLVPNDTNYPSLWALKPPTVGNYGINAQTAWDTTTGSASIVVAVIDTGITNHVDLAGRTVAGYDFIADIPTANDTTARDGDPSDPGDWITSVESTTVGGDYEGCRATNSSWHGTHVSGTIGAIANNSLGVAGINWVSKVQPVRVLGKCGGWTSDIADAITWASGGTVAGVAANATPAKVINMSLGGTGPCPLSYVNAVNTAVANGTLVVVSAGNSGVGAAGSRPANCPGVMAVGATAQSGARSVFSSTGSSNYGAPTTISGPGSSILSTLNTGTTVPVGDTYVNYQGTSMAAPHVAGVASLMLSVRPTLLPHHLAAMIRGTATAFPSNATRDIDCQIQRCGDGIVNAASAVAAAQACAVPPTVGTPAAISEACNGDLDGNGVVSPLTDGLLAIRLASGMSGSALTANALGACATRTTYTALRDFMNRNCGTAYP